MLTGQTMMSNCIIRLTATKTRLRKTMAEPSTQLIFHLQEATEVMKKTSTRKRSTEAQTSPLLLTDAGVKLWLKEYRSHGNGSLSCGKIRERKTQNTHHCHALRFLWICNTSVCRILPHSDVKYVTARRAGDKHVRPASPRHEATGDQVRDGRPHGQNGQAYDHLRDAKGFPHLGAANGHELLNTETGNYLVSASQLYIPQKEEWNWSKSIVKSLLFCSNNVILQRRARECYPLPSHAVWACALRFEIVAVQHCQQQQYEFCVRLDRQNQICVQIS